MIFLNFFWKITISGCNNSDVHFSRFSLTNFYKLSRFQNPQQLRLKIESHFSYLIQKDGSIIRLFKQTFLIFLSSGKRSGFVTKHLAFQQILAKRRTVYSHKGFILTSTTTMNSLSKDFLSCSSFTGKQNRYIGNSHLLCQRNRFLYQLTVTLNILKRISPFHLCFQLFQTPVYQSLLHGPAYQRNNLIIIVAFGYIVVSSILYSLHPIRNIAVSSKQHHFSLRKQLLYL